MESSTAYIISKSKQHVFKNKPQSILTLSEKVTAEHQHAREAEIAKWEEDDKLVKSLLLLALDAKHVKMVMSCETARDIWSRLLVIHEQKSQANKYFLQNEFYEVKMKYDETVLEYICRVEHLASKCTDVGIKIAPSVVVGKIITGLPRRFQPFISVWTNKDEKEQTLVELMARLTAEESSLDRFKKRVEQANNAESKRPNKTKQKNKFNNKNKSKKKSRTKTRSCWKCGSEDHFKKECPDFNKSTTSNAATTEPKPSTSTSHNIEGFEESTVYIVESTCFASDEMSWIVDTGATCHMTPDQNDFDSYVNLPEPRVVKFGGKEISHGVGIGTVHPITKVGDVKQMMTLQNVLHVPDVRRKLISTGSAHGYMGYITPDKIIKNKDNKTCLVAPLINGLYWAIVSQEKAYASIDVDTVDIWHQRFSHINKEYLLKTTNAVNGMQKLKLHSDPKHVNKIDCIACCQGKQRKRTTPLRTTPRAVNVGEARHVDIGGPVGAATIGGGQYYVLYKDEYINYRFVCVLKSRDEVFDTIRKTVQAIKSDTGKDVLNLISDCGSEFTSRRTRSYLIDNKI